VGGYGSSTFSSLPANIPGNITRFCLSVRNKSNVFYNNHHLSGADWYNNSAYLNAANYNMLARKAKTEADYLTDVPGYNHNIKNNISLSPRTSNSHIINYDAAQCVITNNSFLNRSVTTTTDDFLSLDTTLLIAARQPDGSLPVNDFMRLKPTSDLINAGADIGFPFNGSAPDLGAFESNATLPVEMISFTASASENTITLKWHVATEIQNKGWEIERSEVLSTPSQWKKIGFVAGKGDINRLSTYSFIDHVSAGKYQYRLKQVDADGNSKYSPTRGITISGKGKLALSIFPNVVITNALVSYALPSQSQVQILLLTAAGQVIASLVNSVKDGGQYQIQLDDSLLKLSGTYILKMNAGDKVITKSFIKAR